MSPDRPRAISAFVTNLLLAYGGIVFAYWLCYERPVAYVGFVSEDRWAEYATFVAFLIAAASIGWLAIRNPRYRKIGWLGVAAGALFVAGEEISWGQRIFDLPAPDIFREHNQQGELTVHNFVDPRHYFAGIGPAILFLAVVIPLLPRISRRISTLYDRIGVPVVPGRALPLFLLAALMPYADHVRFLPEKAEFLELFLGLALAVMAADLLVRNQGGARTGATRTVASTLGVVGLIWVVSAPLVHEFGRASLKTDLNKYAALRFPAEGMYRQAEAVFRYLSSHPEVQMEDTTLNQAIVYRRSGRAAEAEQVLRNALADQEAQQRARPRDPVPHRAAGRILLLLGEERAGRVALERAAELDVARLRDTVNGPDEWRARWSLGKTYWALGHRDAARDAIDRAQEACPEEATRSEIRRWLSWEERRERLVEKDESGLRSVALADQT